MVKTKFWVAGMILGISLSMSVSCQSILTSHLAKSASQQGEGREREAKTRLQEAYGKLPLSFIQNDGQVDQQVKFYEKGRGHTTFFTKDGVYLTLTRSSEKTNQDKKFPLNSSAISPSSTISRLGEIGHGEITSDVAKLSFVNGNPNPQIIAEGLQEGKVNYLIGNDPKKWRTNISTYQSVIYKEVYPGVDVKFYGNNRQMEYDIIVKPGADPSKVQLSYEGIEKLEVREAGDLVIVLKEGKIIQRKPQVYQEINGRRVQVEGKFKLLNQTFAYSFEVASYDKNHVLIIDPTLVYSSYLGGSGLDGGRNIAVDNQGIAYVTGFTNSLDFPTTTGALNTSYNGGLLDIFVVKLDMNMNNLIYSTYLGGDDDDGYVFFSVGPDIAVDTQGNAYITGGTLSADFPTTPGAFDMTYNGNSDVYVTKLDPTGANLL